VGVLSHTGAFDVIGDVITAPPISGQCRVCYGRQPADRRHRDRGVCARPRYRDTFRMLSSLRLASATGNN